MRVVEMSGVLFLLWGGAEVPSLNSSTEAGGSWHPSPPLAAAGRLPMSPPPPSSPAARPSPTVGSTGQEHIWVLRPHPGGHRGPRSWGLQRGSRLHLVRGLENFKSSGPTHWACGHLSPTGQPGCGWFPRSQGN